MKLHIASSIVLIALTSSAFANPTPNESIAIASPGKLYVGIFGGSGSSNHFDGSQYGVAFYTEAQGGPLSVNAFGQIDDHNAPFFGVQLGYQAQEILLNCSSLWTLSPSAELEGYLISRRSLTGEFINDSPM